MSIHIETGVGDLRNFGYLATASFLALTAAPAFAQNAAGDQSTITDDSSTNAQATQDGDIIVTANRTESLLSKTPVAISAITGEGLREAGITNPTALADQVPNISIDRNSGGLQVTIRGVTSTDVSERGDPSAAFLADGVYIARPQAQEVSFFDIARVEVLRGPQGTLYGRNTTAGLINVISNRPTFDGVNGSVDVGYGNYSMYQANAAVNLPVSENVAFRVAGNFDQRDTFTRFGPLVTGKHDPFRKNLSGRASALFKWDSGELLVRGDYSDIRGHVFDLLPIRNFYADTPTGVDPIHLNRSRRGYLTENANIGWDLVRRNHSWGIGGELTQDIGPLTLSYVGSYREFKRDEEDARISPDAALSYHYSYDGEYQQQSHELRLATNTGGPLTLQAGGYYFEEESSIVLKGLIGLANPGATGDGTTLAFFQDPTKAKSYAFFGQGTWSLTDSLRVTAGARYSHDDKSRVGYTVTCTSFFNCARPANAVPNNNASATFSETTWRVGADFDLTPTTLVYGTVSTGYKAGGFNDGCEIGTGTGCSLTAEALYYDPETLTSYEAGIKARFLQNAVRLNASAFHYDYKNLQLSQLVSDCGGGLSCLVTTNGGRAKVSGVEIEGVLTPTNNIRADFSVTYLDAHYDEFALPPYNFAGRQLDRSPEWVFTAGYQHTIPLGDAGELVAAARTRVSDDYSLFIIGTRNFYRQPGFSKTDLTLTYNAPDARYYLQGFVKNVEDTVTVTTVVVGARASVQVADPRTYGVRAGFKF